MITTITPRESAIAAIASDYQHEALAWSVTAENLEQTVSRMQEEALMMLDLQSEALGVIDTIETETATESESEYLDQIKDKMRALLVAKAGRPA